MLYSDIPEHNGNLRPHQIEAKRKIFEMWNRYDSLMLQMPTGTGKTYLFVSIINDLISYYREQHQELHILVVVHRTELIDQISVSLDKYGIRHGIVQGNREQQLWHRVQVASIQSILSEKNHLNTTRQRFDYIIVDEAHHSLANTYKQLFATFPKAKKLGVTATPYRLNHESFLPLYQKLIVSPQISWFIDHRLLSDFEYVSIRPSSMVQRMINNMEISQTGDFANVDLDEAFNQRPIRAKLFEAYKKYAWGRKGIIYAINKAHAYNIASLYSSRGVKAAAIDCDMPKEERQNMIESFRRGEIKVIVNVEIFTEGFDCADISFIQLARPTCSLALYLQQVGRGLRVVEGKEKTIIIDNVGLYNYFGLPNANRDWLQYFSGCEAEAEGRNVRGGENNSIEHELDDRFEEGDEEMLVIRGSESTNGNTPPIGKDKASERKQLTGEEFTLCDYYLVSGNRERFKVYPFVKKRGKRTEGVGKCLLDYDALKMPMTFCYDTDANVREVARYVKVQAVLSFCAAIKKVPLRNLLNISNFPNSNEDVGLYDVLKQIESKSRR